MIVNLEKWVTKRWQRSDGRYYVIHLEQDLFGDWVIRKIWGGTSKCAGRTVSTPCVNFENAKKEIKRIERERTAKAYKCIHC